MNLYSLSFLLGILCVQQLAALPNNLILFSLAAVCLILAYKRYWLVCFFILGLVWASIFGILRLADQLPDNYQNTIINIKGYIASIPERKDHFSSFEFVLDSPLQHFPKKLKLSWYYPQQTIRAGQAWQFSVKLKQAHGQLNPGGFDYEAWLFANNIGATALVQSKPNPQLLSDSMGIAQYFAKWRQLLIDRIDNALADGKQIGLIKAISLGDQSDIHAMQWQVFRATGTTHLIVISGSHISLIAGLVFIWVRRSWAKLGILHIAPQHTAAWVAWIFAMFYAALAGYSIPTLRAIIMLSVGLSLIVLQRHSSAWQILLIALLTLLLIDPFAVISAGFWLSFLAVALLIYISAGRLGRSSTWRELAHTQIASFVGLSPLLIIFFNKFHSLPQLPTF